MNDRQIVFLNALNYFFKCIKLKPKNNDSYKKIRSLSWINCDFYIYVVKLIVIIALFKTLFNLFTFILNKVKKKDNKLLYHSVSSLDM